MEYRMWIRDNDDLKSGPAGHRIIVHVSKGNVFGISYAPLSSMPGELLSANLETFLNHPWTLPLKEQAEAALQKSIDETLRSLT